MHLERDELALFFRLHRNLMFFVDRQLEILPDRPATAEAYCARPPEQRVLVHAALVSHRELIPAFVAENPAGFPHHELEIVSSWEQLVCGRFYLYRELKKHALFISLADRPVVYGVRALRDPFEGLVPGPRPSLVETTLLPLGDKIVYDGLLGRYHVALGPGYRRSLDTVYRTFKERHGVITALPALLDAENVSQLAQVQDRRAKRRGRSANEAPSPDGEAIAAIWERVEPFCREFLNEDYVRVCRKLLKKLAGMDPSPLASGNPNGWAAGLVRAVGWSNFLFDRTQVPHMPAGKIDAHFGVSESNGAAKKAAICSLVKIRQLDPRWAVTNQVDGSQRRWKEIGSKFRMLLGGLSKRRGY